MSDKRDFYEVLGVDRDADQRTIKRAFLKKARTVHPDVSDDPEAEEKFKELNEAYSVLSDEQKRANYDRFGTADGMGGSGYVDINDIFGGMGMDDIFSSIFGGGAAGGSRRSRSTRRRGRDMAISMHISLEEAATGCTKNIQIERMAPCKTCDGSGMEDGAHEMSCPRCGGTGFVTTVQRSFLGQVQSSSPCPDCGGEGTVLDHPCPDCHGEGRSRQSEKISVEIPAGISDGRQVRIPSKGEAGFRGEAAGDLIVSVGIDEHERFQRSGDDLYCVVEVSMAQAALGCKVEVDGIMEDEKVVVEVPAGTQYGDNLGVSGKGMPRLGGGGARGDLVCQVRVNVPRHLTPAQREALVKFADEMGESVSEKKTARERIRERIDDILE